jgi:predicted 3-demethylubiquinone-9 3-methyltransferase (glyoxalase superfamily)
MKKTHHNFVNGLWFDRQAEEAARFYTSVFPDSRMGDITYFGKEGFEIHGGPEGSVMTADFTLSGTAFQGVNGGPLFKMNPSISYFVVCETEKETKHLWNSLLQGGKVLMPMDKYDWSEQYGWVQDKFGLSWQISLGKISDVGQKITASFLFVGDQCGRAEEAIKFYTSIFPNSGIRGIMKVPAGSKEQESNVMHGQFHLNGTQFMIMDSADNHDFKFNEGVSIIVNCTTQEEIDHYWYKLSADGGQEIECGWLKDKFGVAWQIVPVQLEEMLKSKDKAKTERVTKAFLRMRKFDIAQLEDAFKGVTATV